MKKIRDFNLGYLVDLSYIPLTYYIYKFIPNMNGKSFIPVGICLGVWALFLYIYLEYQETKITNKYNGKSFFKPEDDETAEILPQGENYGIDGIKVKGKIRKTPDGTQATIRENGSIQIDSLTGNILYLLAQLKVNDLPSDWDALKQKQ